MSFSPLITSKANANSGTISLNILGSGQGNQKKLARTPLSSNTTVFGVEIQPDDSHPSELSNSDHQGQLSAWISHQ